MALKSSIRLILQRHFQCCSLKGISFPCLDKGFNTYALIITFQMLRDNSALDTLITILTVMLSVFPVRPTYIELQPLDEGNVVQVVEFNFSQQPKILIALG